MKVQHLKYFPRFIHYFEFQLLLLGFPDVTQLRERKELYKKIWDYYWRINYNQLPSRPNPIRIEKQQGKAQKLSFVGMDRKPGKIRVGIANVNVSLENYVNVLKGGSSFDLKIRDQFNKVINEAIAWKVDILVLPECYINPRWLNKIHKIARKHQMAIVFGLEYVIDRNKKIVNNYLVSLLPFKLGFYNNCIIDMRLKNHYSPDEKSLINQFNLQCPNTENLQYTM